MITFRYRTLMVFAAGFAVALIAVFAFQSWRADAAPGDTDTTFIPITPCRLLDTRPGDDQVGPRSTPIGEDSPVMFTAWDSGDDDSLCQIPSSATAISTNTTIVNPTTSSFLKLYPADAALPPTSNLNYVAGQSATPNAVTIPLSATGQFNVYNRFGSVDVIVDINGYYTKTSLQELTSRITALEAGAGTDPTILARIAALETENAELKELTASMSLETVDGENTVRFSGVNVQVVSGSKTTDGAINGTGNLIVGYNENDSDVRTGSHNLIVGPEHSYSSYGGFLAGFNNTASGDYASVSGGRVNEASGDYASVSGGQSNAASSSYASVSGGLANAASGGYASVSGGYNNTASSSYASVSGGSTNTASNNYASVSGGLNRSATGSWDWVAGSLFEDN